MKMFFRKIKINKNLVFCAVLLFFAGLAAGEFNPYKRYFEIEVNVGDDTGISNNWFSLNDFTQETLVVDFNEMSRSLKNGLTMNLTGNTGFDMKMKFTDDFKMRIFANADIMAQANISREIIDFLANGNSKENMSVNGAFETDGSAFISAGTDMTMFFNKLGVTLRGELFIPAFYIPRNSTAVSVSAKDNGEINCDFSAYIPVYSPFLVAAGKGISTGDLIKNGGIDFGVGLEYRFLENLEAGITLYNIPVKAAAVYNYANVSLDGNYSIDSILNVISGNSKINQEFKFNELEYVTTGTPKLVYRPVDLGLDVLYKPFDELLYLRGGMNFVFYDPFIFNFDLGVDLNLFKIGKMGSHILTLSYETGYVSRNWIQRGILNLDFRVLNLRFAATSKSPSFAGSFTGKGIALGLGIAIGY